MLVLITILLIVSIAWNALNEKRINAIRDYIAVIEYKELLKERDHE